MRPSCLERFQCRGSAATIDLLSGAEEGHGIAEAARRMAAVSTHFWGVRGANA